MSYHRAAEETKRLIIIRVPKEEIVQCHCYTEAPDSGRLEERLEVSFPAWNLTDICSNPYSRSTGHMSSCSHANPSSLEITLAES
jgi:hypothetical protein